MTDIVEKPLEDEDLSGALILSFDEEHGSQNHEDIDSLFWIGRHRWDRIAGIFMEIPSMILIVRALGLKIQILCLLDSQRTWRYVMHCLPLISIHTSSTKRKVCCWIKDIHHELMVHKEKL
jgi:hypothetical protein